MSHVSQRQLDELDALDSIFGDKLTISHARSNETVVTLSIPLSWTDEKEVVVHSVVRRGSIDSVTVHHLPPISLRATLPHEYPDTASPTVSVTSCIPGLLARLHDVIDRNRSQECLFDLADSLSPDQLEQTLPWPVHIKADPDRIRAYDKRMSDQSFVAGHYNCDICLEQRKGQHCIKLQPCGDVFCASCLSDYFGLLIREGLVLSVKCPGTACSGSSAPQLDVDQVKAITHDEDLAKRYERLLEKVRVESDPTITFCPRDSCQAPVPRPHAHSRHSQPGQSDNNDDNNNNNNADEVKLRVCPSCSLAFCVFCKRVWHGTANACALPASSALVSRYLSSSEPDKRALERQYGTVLLQKLVRSYLEERAAIEYIQSHSTPCPTCHKPVERSEGCNHMTCSSCQTHFCYLCGSRLDQRDPYRHFSTPGARCYGKLFPETVRPGSEPEFRVEDWLDPDDIGEVLANLQI